MPEHLLAIFDDLNGNLLLDDTDPVIAAAIAADLDLGEPESLGCALPREVLTLPPVDLDAPAPCSPRVHGVCCSGDYDGEACSLECACHLPVPTIRISGYWHDSLIEGPGRRSVVRMQGCPIRCDGCWLSDDLLRMDGGVNASVPELADALLDDTYVRDGVTILGGEPFAQPRALVALIEALRARDPELHITVYTGYTLGALQVRMNLYIDRALGLIDMLIDGPYVKALASGAGPWTGSANQHVIEFPRETPACTGLNEAQSTL